MSRVISFRLNPNNPREAEALSVLQKQLTEGFTIRQTITKAILMLDSVNLLPTENQAFNDLSKQIKELLENIENRASQDNPVESTSSKEKLSNGFVTSILKTAKTGLRLEE